MTPLKTLSSNPWAFSPLIALIGPYSAKAHEGHGDTVVHAGDPPLRRRTLHRACNRVGLRSTRY